MPSTWRRSTSYPWLFLNDQHLADSYRAVHPDRFDTDVDIDRGELLTEEDQELNGDYLRHEFTDSGISPRAVPGNKYATYKTTGNEHNQNGDTTEDPEIRTKMMDKRMKKLDTALDRDVEGPKRYGPEEAEITFLGWGSPYGAVREAVDKLNDEGISSNSTICTIFILCRRKK